MPRAERLDPNRDLSPADYDIITPDRTPKVVFDALDAIYGFTLDAAADEYNHLCPTYYTPEDNGLVQPWSNHHVFVNPPAELTSSFVAKAIYETTKGSARCVVMLIAVDGRHAAMVDMHADHVLELPAKVLALENEAGRPVRCQIVVFLSKQFPLDNKV